MRRTVFAVMLSGSVCFVHCGSDEETSGEKICRQVEAKLTECGLMIDPAFRCRADTATQQCAGQCLIDAPCAELTSNATDTNYIRCQAECSGAGPDDFICANGEAFLPQSELCNGVPQCPDGSDETSCGAPDAGTD